MNRANQSTLFLRAALLELEPTACMLGNEGNRGVPAKLRRGKKAGGQLAVVTQDGRRKHWQRQWTSDMDRDHTFNLSISRKRTPVPRSAGDVQYDTYPEVIEAIIRNSS